MKRVKTIEVGIGSMRRRLAKVEAKRLELRRKVAAHLAYDEVLAKEADELCSALEADGEEVRRMDLRPLLATFTEPGDEIDRAPFESRLRDLRSGLDDIRDLLAGRW